MDDQLNNPVVVEVQRELVRLATGILMQRYGVASATAESALMDWSRISGRDVPDLAARVIADARRTAAGRD